MNKSTLTTTFVLFVIIFLRLATLASPLVLTYSTRNVYRKPFMQLKIVRCVRGRSFLNELSHSRNSNSNRSIVNRSIAFVFFSSSPSFSSSSAHLLIFLWSNGIKRRYTLFSVCFSKQTDVHRFVLRKRLAFSSFLFSFLFQMKIWTMEATTNVRWPQACLRFSTKPFPHLLDPSVEVHQCCALFLDEFRRCCNGWKKHRTWTI